MIVDLAVLLREWFKLKTTLSQKSSGMVFKQQEIWWCSVGVNLGEETLGKDVLFTRPVLVFRKLTKNSFLGLPLTTQEKQGSWYVEITIHATKSWVMLNQAKMIDSKRMVDRIGKLGDRDFALVKERFHKFYCP